MFSWFKKKELIPEGNPLHVDIHSHLLSGIDDGVQSLEQALEVVLLFKELGYTKLITSPHVMNDMYRNTTDTILRKRDELRTFLKAQQVEMEIDSVAEYYLDEVLMSRLLADEPLLTFGNKYLLFETNFLTEPFQLKEFIFQSITKGYKPVMAHPERYGYLNENFHKAQDLLDRGVLFQLNISSFSGYYSKPAQRTAEQLVDNGSVHFLGSDCHHMQHARLVRDARQLKYYKKALALPLLNNSL